MTMHSVISRYRVRRALPAKAGIGLRAEHFEDILADRPHVAFFEISAGDCMTAGGPNQQVDAIRRAYPLALRAASLSLGGAAPLDRARLTRLREMLHRYEPGLVSDRLAASRSGVSDAPFPYNTATLRLIADHVDEAQTRLATRMLLENPCAHATAETSTLAEVQFLRELVRCTGCGLLLDLGNVLASASGHGYDPYAYVDAFPLEHVGEIRLSGLASAADAAWRLYQHCLGWIGPVPTLVARDGSASAFGALLAEAEVADRILARQKRRYEELLGAA